MAYYSEEELADLGFKRLGRNVRISKLASIYNHDQIEIGDHSRIDDFCVVSGKVSIGRNVHITVFCNVAGGGPGITIGDFVALAYRCTVFTQSDDYSGQTLTNSTVPDQYKEEIKAPISIGRHCIVGAGSIIFPGVRLAEGTSVGAMTLMLKDSEAWSIYCGSPGRKLKDRKRDLLKLEAAYLSSPEA